MTTTSSISSNYQLTEHYYTIITTSSHYFRRRTIITSSPRYYHRRTKRSGVRLSSSSSTDEDDVWCWLVVVSRVVVSIQGKPAGRWGCRHCRMELYSQRNEAVKQRHHVRSCCNCHVAHVIIVRVSFYSRCCAHFHYFVVKIDCHLSTLYH